MLEEIIYPVFELVEMSRNDLALWTDFVYSQDKSKQSWFWKSPEYKDWRNNNGSQFLLCTGKTAISNSSMAAAIISSLS